jgi:DnaJ-class molecular chaperone
MSKRIKCPECNGEGQLEYERWVPRSFQDDVGGYETYTRNCDNCGGYGEIPYEEEDEV